jgi:hypothetical protein
MINIHVPHRSAEKWTVITLGVELVVDYRAPRWAHHAGTPRTCPGETSCVLPGIGGGRPPARATDPLTLGDA